jgi:hypothetical protein
MHAAVVQTEAETHVGWTSLGALLGAQTEAELTMSVFKECDWKEFYGKIKEAIPPNAPESRGKDITLTYVCSAIPTTQGTNYVVACCGLDF